MPQKNNVANTEALKQHICNLKYTIKEKNNAIKRLQTWKKHQSNGIEMIDIDTQTLCAEDYSFQSSSSKEEIDKYKKQISQNNYDWQVELNKTNKEWQIKYQEKIDQIDYMNKNSKNCIDIEIQIIKNNYEITIDNLNTAIFDLKNLLHNYFKDYNNMTIQIIRPQKQYIDELLQHIKNIEYDYNVDRMYIWNKQLELTQC
jgi:hypothetical protein